MVKIFKSEILRAGVPTPAGHIYPEDVLKKAVADRQKDIAERRMLGTIETPTDGVIHMSKVSHIVTELKVEDGKLLGSIEILPTTEGKKLLDMLGGKGKKRKKDIGLSVYGVGMTTRDLKNNEVVTDYSIGSVVIKPKEPK